MLPLAANSLDTREPASGTLLAFSVTRRAHHWDAPFGGLRGCSSIFGCASVQLNAYVAKSVSLVSISTSIMITGYSR